jgi:hypothetical protein
MGTIKVEIIFHDIILPIESSIWLKRTDFHEDQHDVCQVSHQQMGWICDGRRGGCPGNIAQNIGPTQYHPFKRPYPIFPSHSPDSLLF